MNHQFVADVTPDTFTHLEFLLEKRPLQMNEYRLKSGSGRSQAFGIVKQRNGHYHGSRQNFVRADLYQELMRIADILPEDFTYDGIQLNQNYETKPHKDVGNRGMSAIIGFGDYTGGELVIEETTVDIKNKLVLFDGSIYTHHTKPFTGNRYSIVFFTVKKRFKEKPVYSFFNYENNLYMKEVVGGVEKWWNKKGDCVWSSDGILPQKRLAKPTLSACVELD